MRTTFSDPFVYWPVIGYLNFHFDRTFEPIGEQLLRITNQKVEFLGSDIPEHNCYDDDLIGASLDDKIC